MNHPRTSSSKEVDQIWARKICQTHLRSPWKIKAEASDEFGAVGVVDMYIREISCLRISAITALATGNNEVAKRHHGGVVPSGFWRRASILDANPRKARVCFDDLQYFLIDKLDESERHHSVQM
jgi:hypothetical protein